MSREFDSHQEAWRDYTAAPWARIRYAVVRHVLLRTLDELGPGPHRVLDVGGGDGLDSLALAEAGHEVTILDPSAPMLEAAAQAAAATGVPLVTLAGGLDDLSGTGEYDVVLCHFVVQYRPDEAADLALLAGAVRPGGLLSLIAPNPVGQALAALVRRGPAAATAELGRDSIRTETFDRDVRKLSAEQVVEAMPAGWSVAGRYGGRIANDLLADNDPKHDPAYFQDLLALELSLCDRKPYNEIGAYWHLVLTH